MIFRSLKSFGDLKIYKSDRLLIGFPQVPDLEAPLAIFQRR